MMKYKGEIILYAIVLIAFVSAVVTAVNCDGTLVRGLIWLECIGE